MATFWELPIDARNVFPNWFIQNTDPALDPNNRVTVGKQWIKTTNDTPPYGPVVGLFYMDSTGLWEPMLSSGPAGPPGSAGTPGSVWYNGVGAPAGGLGINGDYYVRTDDWNVYQKAGGVWGVVFNIRGEPGATGTGLPGSPGRDGDDGDGGGFGGGSTQAPYNTRLVGVPFIIDDGGAVIVAGLKGGFEVPFDATIIGVRMGALDGLSSSMVVDLWKDTYANFPPTVADTITASAKPTITTATKSKDDTLTGWAKDVKAGDWIFVNVDSNTAFTKVALSLVMLKN